MAEPAHYPSPALFLPHAAQIRNLHGPTKDIRAQKCARRTPGTARPPSAPQADAHFWEPQEGRGVFTTQFRSPESKLEPHVRCCPARPRASCSLRSSRGPLPAAFPSFSASTAMRSPGSPCRTARCAIASKAQSDVGGACKGPLRPCLLLQPERARSGADGHFTLRICVPSRIFCRCLRVYLRPDAATNVHLLNATINPTAKRPRSGRRVGAGESCSLKRRRRSAWPRYYVGRR